jgi:hypothetical protein
MLANVKLVTVLGPYVSGMFVFVQGVATDGDRSESTTRALLGLLGYVMRLLPLTFQ